jgi:hypothetical protein
VLQTALDLLENNYDVHVLADGVSSMNSFEIEHALNVRCFFLLSFFLTTAHVTVFLLQIPIVSCQNVEPSDVFCRQRISHRGK